MTALDLGLLTAVLVLICASAIAVLALRRARALVRLDYLYIAGESMQ